MPKTQFNVSHDTYHFEPEGKCFDAVYEGVLRAYRSMPEKRRVLISSVDISANEMNSRMINVDVHLAVEYTVKRSQFSSANARTMTFTDKLNFYVGTTPDDEKNATRSAEEQFVRVVEDALENFAERLHEAKEQVAFALAPWTPERG